MADNVSQETASEPAATRLTSDEAALIDFDDGSEPEVKAKPVQSQEESVDEASNDEPAETVEVEADELEEGAASEEDAEPEAKDDVLIKMDDGSTVTVAELKAEASTLKTENARISQEVANERRELQQTAEKVTGTYDVLLNYLASKLPQEPDPQLLWSDPTRHHQMTYLRNAAIEELQSLLGAKQGVEGVAQQISDDEFKRYEAAENAKLIAAVPNLKDPARMKAAMDKAKSYAKSIGFSDDEFDKTKDARIQRMVIDAAYGATAREAAQKAKVQVKSAVAKAPMQQRSAHPNSLKALDKNNAWKAFEKNPSLKNAALIDFD
jgi:hypothetical protein